MNENEAANNLSKILQYKISEYIPDKPISRFGCA